MLEREAQITFVSWGISSDRRVMNSAEGAYFGGWWMDCGAVKRWPLRLKSTESNGPNDVDITT